MVCDGKNGLILDGTLLEHVPSKIGETWCPRIKMAAAEDWLIEVQYLLVGLQLKII